MSAEDPRTEKTGRMSPTDNQLMEDVRDGRVEKLAVLFERYQTMLFNFFLRLTGNRAASEDLVQESFFRMLKYRTTYRAEASFAVWMYRIARNVLADRWRRTAPTDPLEVAHEIEAPGSSPYDDARLGQEVTMLRTALLSLPRDRRELIALVRNEALRYDVIAELLDCSVGAVKVRTHRALAELRDAYMALTGGDNDLRRAERAAD